MYVCLFVLIPKRGQMELKLVATLGYFPLPPRSVLKGTNVNKNTILKNCFKKTSMGKGTGAGTGKGTRSTFNAK